jgi:DNA gyrase subunit A
LNKTISECEGILASEQKVIDIIKEETTSIKEKFGDIRRTKIVEGEDEDIEDEDLIPQEDQVVSISKSGYVKRLPIDTYKTQNRGGKGVIGASMKEEDIIEHLFIANTHSYLLIITTTGLVDKQKVRRLLIL